DTTSGVVAAQLAQTIENMFYKGAVIAHKDHQQAFRLRNSFGRDPGIGGGIKQIKGGGGTAEFNHGRGRTCHKKPPVQCYWHCSEQSRYSAYSSISVLIFIY